VFSFVGCSYRYGMVIYDVLHLCDVDANGTGRSQLLLLMSEYEKNNGSISVMAITLTVNCN
jgi:hypothetical protein